jgi:hypothetical protein
MTSDFWFTYIRSLVTHTKPYYKSVKLLTYTVEVEHTLTSSILVLYIKYPKTISEKNGQISNVDLPEVIHQEVIHQEVIHQEK